MKGRVTIFITFLLMICWYLFMGAEILSIFTSDSKSAVKQEQQYPRDTSIFDKSGRLQAKYFISKLGDTTKYIYWKYNLEGKDSVRNCFNFSSYNLGRNVIEYISDSLFNTKVLRRYDSEDILIDSIVVVYRKSGRQVVKFMKFNSKKELRYFFNDSGDSIVHREIYYDTVYQVLKDKCDTISKKDTLKSRYTYKVWEMLQNIYWDFE